MRLLPTWDAQRRVVVKEWRQLSSAEQHLWQTILLACAPYGVPIDDPQMQVQLTDLWGAHSVTLRQLLA